MIDFNVCMRGSGQNFHHGGHGGTQRTRSKAILRTVSSPPYKNAIGGLNPSRNLPIEDYEVFFLMPTVDQYVATVVEKYHIAADTGSASHHAADEIVPLLKQWGKQYLLGITLSGAYAKNTAIHLSSDVDVLIAVSSVPNMDMKQIFWSLFEFLTDQSLRPHTWNVSIQVERHGLFVDLLPTCSHRGGNLLFNKRSGQIVETDVAQHVHLVANSGRQQEICALKIWRERNGLDFPSLYLEMTVLKALETERFGQLADNVLTVLRFLAGRFPDVVVRDPANTRNVLSNDLAVEAKKAISAAARNALYDENWKKIVW